MNKMKKFQAIHTAMEPKGFKVHSVKSPEPLPGYKGPLPRQTPCPVMKARGQARAQAARYPDAKSHAKKNFKQGPKQRWEQ